MRFLATLTALHALLSIDLICSLNQGDRETLEKATKTLSTHAMIGSIVGLGLGVALAYRVRAFRTKTFTAFRAMEKPTHVQFAGGRTGKYTR